MNCLRMTTKTDKNQLVLDTYGLAVSLALSFHRSTGVDMDELVSVASVALCNAADSFDAARGVKFSTYAYYAIRNDLVDFTRQFREWAYSWREMLSEPEGSCRSADKSVRFREGVHSLSETALQVCKLVWAGNTSSQKQLLEEMKLAGVGVRRTKRAFQEIRKFIREIDTT